MTNGELQFIGFAVGFIVSMFVTLLLTGRRQK